MRSRSSAAIAVSFASLVVASVTSCGDPAPHSPVRSEGGRLLDRAGREVLLRGVNARVRGVFDVSFDDGRQDVEPIPAFVEEDCRLLGEDLGMNHLRLPVSWSGIEPHDDDFREDYLARVLEVAAFCERHDVHTLVDFHQDAFSKEIGEDGAPLWAIQPPPTMLLGGPLTDLTARRLSSQVANAFDTFFHDRAGGWDQFAQMAAWVARRIEGKPGIVGLELFNEPQLLFEDALLVDFHRHVAQQVREAAPTLPVFFEPSAFRNISDMDPADPPFAFENSVYSPHVYTDVFEDGWASEDVAKLQTSIAGTRTEATTHGAALYVGEFGHGPDAHGALYVREAMNAFDVRLASYAYWVYEESSQDGWGLYDSDASGNRVGLRTDRADLMARPFPAAVDGRLASIAYDATNRVLTVALANAGSGEHVLTAPTRTYPAGVEVRCDGTVVASSLAAGRARARCRGTTLELRPAP